MNVYTLAADMSHVGNDGGNVGGSGNVVWMESGAVPPPNAVPLGLNAHADVQGDVLSEHHHDSHSYYTSTTASSHQSVSNHSLDDINNMHHSSMAQIDRMDIQMDSNDSEGSLIDEDYPDMQLYMMNSGGQADHYMRPHRKIKPVSHPGLVLKSPIAYQSNTDPSVIPIEKHGIAVCQNCGAIGVKHAFYTRERRFCSMECAKTFNGMPLSLESVPASDTSSSGEAIKESAYAQHEFKMEYQDDFTGHYICEPLPQLEEPKIIYQTMQPVQPSPKEEPKYHKLSVEDLNLLADVTPLSRRKHHSQLANSFSWKLLDDNLIAAPITAFRKTPMQDIWADTMAVGMKVEVENTDCDNVSDTFADSFWVATVLRIVGYKALLRYEGFGMNTSKDFWVSLCSNEVHPVGWSATRGKPLIPPKSIQNRYSDWKEFLQKRLTGARTLPSNFGLKVADSLKGRFQCGLQLEVVDKNRISQVKVAVVHRIVGKRLNVRYYDLPPDDNGFWCHEDSPLLHPVGWALKVGHNLVASPEYIDNVRSDIKKGNYATDELFNEIQIGVKEESSPFMVGMKVEAIDPLNLSAICAATVMAVLRYGFIMIRIDNYETDMSGADWFCYHRTSCCIFPIGFCEMNNIPLTPPNGYDSTLFTWERYLAETGNQAAPPDAFGLPSKEHAFRVGMKIEAADLMDPRLVCVATIGRVVGRMLKVHFDGWEDEYDQWLDCDSPDIYPVGWCDSVCHKLEGPRVMPKSSDKHHTPNRKTRKRRKKKSPMTKENCTVQVNNAAKPAAVQALLIEGSVAEVEADDPGGCTTPAMNFENSSDNGVERIATPDAAADNSSNIPCLTPKKVQSVSPTSNTSTSPSVTDKADPTLPAPPSERKATSYINTQASPPKAIPRLIDTVGALSQPVTPTEWNVFDVAQFLRVNDCANYCDLFSRQKIDGTHLLKLNKEDILDFTGGKVGPSLKIYDLIQQLKIKVNPAQSRQMKSNFQKFL